MAFNLEDLKEQATTSLKNFWEQFQESSFFNQLKDQFENLSPFKQKLVLMASAVLVVLFFLSLPWSYFSASTSFVTDFEDKRTLIRDLLKVSRETNENPDIPIPPQVDILKSKIEALLLQAQFLPEQMLGIEISADSSSLLIPEGLAQGFLKVTLAKLNLRQILDVGYKLQTQSPSVKMKDLIIAANAQNPKYFDVVYKLAILKVPELPTIIPESEEPKSTRSKKISPKENK